MSSPVCRSNVKFANSNPVFVHALNFCGVDNHACVCVRMHVCVFLHLSSDLDIFTQGANMANTRQRAAMSSCVTHTRIYLL